MSIEKPTVYARPHADSGDRKNEGHITGGWDEIARTSEDASHASMVPGFISIDSDGNYKYERAVRLRHPETGQTIRLPVGEHDRLQETMRALNETYPELSSRGISADAQIAANGIISQVPGGRGGERSHSSPASRSNEQPVVARAQVSQANVPVAAPSSEVAANNNNRDEEDPFGHLWDVSDNEKFDIERAAVRNTPEELAERRAKLAAHARRIDDLNAAENARVGRPEMGWRAPK